MENMHTSLAVGVHHVLRKRKKGRIRAYHPSSKLRGLKPEATNMCNCVELFRAEAPLKPQKLQRVFGHIKVIDGRGKQEVRRREQQALIRLMSKCQEAELGVCRERRD